MTKALIGINLVIYLITVIQGEPQHPSRRVVFVPNSRSHRLWLDGPSVAHGDWYRLVTSMFLHATILHIGFNMYVLWVIGTPSSSTSARRATSGSTSSPGSPAPPERSCSSARPHRLGASGAIFGILGAMMILEWQVTGRLAGQAAALVAINLGLSFVIPEHLVGRPRRRPDRRDPVMLAYGHWGGSRSRAQYGQLGLGGVLGLVLVGVGSVAVAYFRVRGYAYLAADWNSDSRATMPRGNRRRIARSGRVSIRCRREIVVSRWPATP